MSSHTPIKLADGTVCRSGPNCKRHGGKRTLFASLQDVFARAEKEAPHVVLPAQTTDQEFANAAKTHFNSLAPNEKFALHQYSDRSGSVLVNRLLNNNTHPSRFPADAAKLMEGLDSGISKATTSEERTLYRGVEEFPTYWEGLKAGDQLQELSYSSTSLSAAKALEFTNRDKPVLIQFITSKGAPVLVHENEHEILLPRDEEYEVVSVQTNQSVSAEEPRYSPEQPPSSRKVTRSNVTLITLKSFVP
jgi:hypothetical protein